MQINHERIIRANRIRADYINGMKTKDICSKHNIQLANLKTILTGKSCSYDPKLYSIPI